MQAPIPFAAPPVDVTPPVEPLNPHAWYMRRLYLPMAKALTRYHRAHTNPPQTPTGPCIYVTHHGFGYLSMDIFVAAYLIGFRKHFELGGAHTNLRTTISLSQLEKYLPFLGTVRNQVGGIAPETEAIVAALQAGQQVLMTPGGRREAQPSRVPYELRWAQRFGFVRIALRTGAPIVPLATVGGHRAFPGFASGKLSFWSPLPLPARLRVSLGEPIKVPFAPDRVDDTCYIEEIQQTVWDATQMLYNQTRGQSGAA